MEKLSQNKFLTGMAVVGVVAVAGFGILVYPAWSEAGTKVKSIKTSVGKLTGELEDLPGDPNVKAWTDQAESLKKRFAGSPTENLGKLAALDKNLGQWFDGIEDSSGFVAFLTPYDDERQKLEEEVLSKGVLLGSPIDKDGVSVETRLPGFNWITRADIVTANTTEKEMHAKEILQKRFNICRAIVNAVTADVDKSLRPRRLLDVTFLEKFPYVSSSLVDPGSKAYLIPIDQTRYSGFFGVGKGNYVEHSLPSNGDEPLPGAESEAGKTPESTSAQPPKPKPMGKTITVGFAVVMDYSQVPALVRNLIDSKGMEPELNLSIVGLSVFVHTPNKIEVNEKVKLKANETKETYEKKGQDETNACPPPQVHVYVTCQVFDFDPASVPAFLKP